MAKYNLLILLVVGLVAAVIIIGCVERNLTINTEPQEALVVLNDEEIGTSPVTVSFEWYGDYNVRVSKEGFETLKTHRKLNRPWYDKFPFDFFTMLNPERTIDEYEWTFELAPKKEMSREELIQNAEELKKTASAAD
ncbi:MAG TPA: PEGA domain-containing protein [Planctomycetes bacterium]|nr:PEGA domain-containing protein [Planctomycetota bacterium]